MADYSHVPAGPGVILIADEANYSLEHGPEDRLGLLYNTKEVLDGSNAERIKRALRQALKAASRLQEDYRLQDSLKFSGQEIRLCINSRAMAPNEDRTCAALMPDLKLVFDAFYNSPEYKMSHVSSEPRERFAVQIECRVPNDLSVLLRRISS